MADNGHVGEEAVYAAACVMLQNNQADVALQILGDLGDVNMIDLVSGAWTNADYGKAANTLMDALVDPSVRYLKGKNTSYLPDPNAFCLLDALECLMDDDKAKFYPRHPAFYYKRIGVPSVPAEGYPKFEYGDDPACPFSELVWNEDRLNLSVRATLLGAISLSDGWQPLGLPNPYPCVVFRNYTLIKDGVLNVTSMPISMSSVTWDILNRNNMIKGFLRSDGSYEPGNWTSTDTIWLVDFSAVPLINLRVASEEVTAEDICMDSISIYRAGALVKVLKYWRDQLDPNKEVKTDEALTFEQETFLAKLGVRRGVFSPPVVKGESTDKYLAKEFKISGKGFSSLPKVDDVIKKIEDGKDLTPSQQFISDALDWYEAHQVGGTTEETIKWIDRWIRETRRQQNDTRSIIQRVKFGIILNKKWFSDLNTRDGAQLVVDGITFTFNIKDVEVAY
jgi:hypothetical protein